MRFALTLAVTGVVMLAAAGGCAKDDPAPFNPRNLQQVQRAHAGETAPEPVHPMPTTLQSPFSESDDAPATRPAVVPATGRAIGGEPVARLSLREIVQRAVTNNHDVKVAGYQPAIDQTRTTENEARFDPVFFANARYRDDKVIQPSVNNTGFTVTNERRVDEFRTFQEQVGLRQTTGFGTQVELRYEVNRTRRNNVGATGDEINPFWSNQLVLEVTQPLLQNFGQDVNRARITIARNNQKISLLDFRKALEENSRDIEEAYWQLVQAERDLRTQERLLSETVGTGQRLFDRRNQDVNRTQIAQANSSIESRRADLIRARARVRDLSDRLKQLMDDPDFPISGDQLVLPADAPLEQQVKLQYDDQVVTGLENRYELAQQQLRIDSAMTALLVGKNQLLPKLNLVGQANFQGLDNQFTGAIDRQANSRFFAFNFGVEFEIPIGNREARSVYRRAQLQRMQAIESYQGLVALVTTEVKQATREVETSWQEVTSRRQARFAAEEALRAAQDREESGDAAAFSPDATDRKLRYQEQLAQSEREEHAAIAGYNVSLSRLELRKGTLLRYNNVIMDEAPASLVSDRKAR